MSVLIIPFVVLILIVAFWPKFGTGTKWCILGSAASVILIAWYLLNEAFSYHWPKIVDSTKLRHEASAVWQTAHLPRFGPPWNPSYLDDRILIPKQEWPESIADLHPKAVHAGKDFVSVMTDGTGRSGPQAWGYYIYIDGVQRKDGGIEKWHLQDEQPHR